MGRSCDDSRDLAMRERASRDCARHLKDLQRAHAGPPPDVAVASSPPERLRARFSPPEASSGCSSPAERC
jgi:hypothetical protein